MTRFHATVYHGNFSNRFPIGIIFSDSHFVSFSIEDDENHKKLLKTTDNV